MTKSTKKTAEPRVADHILQGLKEALAFERGELTDVRVDRVLITARAVDAAPPPEFRSERVIDLRKKKMGVSQAVFASALNVSPETVRAWEQGKNTPGGPALRLLELAEAQPGLILTKISGKTPSSGSATRGPHKQASGGNSGKFEGVKAGKKRIFGVSKAGRAAARKK